MAAFNPFNAVEINASEHRHCTVQIMQYYNSHHSMNSDTVTYIVDINVWDLAAPATEDYRFVLVIVNVD